MKKRVLIVEPTSVKANVFDADSQLPLMGTLILGTILEDEGYDVKVINENLLRDKLKSSDMDADYLLLSCLTPTIERGLQIAVQFRKRNPDSKIIIGGVHATFLPEELTPYADHVVLGEGENVISDLLRYGSDDKIIQGSTVEDLDRLPLPNFNLLVNGERINVTPIVTSRGCPFGCNFCSVTKMFGRRYRTVSVQRALAEINRASTKSVFFYDDNFAANSRRTHELMDGLIESRPRIRRWSAQVRSDIARDESLVKKMAAAKCSRVYIGFESVNQKTLEALNKHQKPEEIRHAMEIFHRSDIRVHGMFMFGSDEDDSRVVEDTLNFVKKNHIDSVQFMALTPLPGTDLFHRLAKAGRLLHKKWSYYDGLHVVFEPLKFSPYELQKSVIDSFSDFYSLTSAFNEGLNLAAESLLKGLLNIRASIRRTSAVNVGIKLGGRFIVKKWIKLNSEYMRYLKSLKERVQTDSI